MKSKRMKALLFMSMAVLATACGKEEVNTAESQTQITEEVSTEALQTQTSEEITGEAFMPNGFVEEKAFSNNSMFCTHIKLPGGRTIPQLGCTKYEFSSSGRKAGA